MIDSIKLHFKLGLMHGEFLNLSSTTDDINLTLWRILKCIELEEISTWTVRESTFKELIETPACSVEKIWKDDLVQCLYFAWFHEVLIYYHEITWKLSSKILKLVAWLCNTVPFFFIRVEACPYKLKDKCALKISPISMYCTQDLDSSYYTEYVKALLKKRTTAAWWFFL